MAKPPKRKEVSKENKPATFLQFRRKSDERKIAKAQAEGGTVKTKSRHATNPVVPSQQMRKGSTVKVEKKPGSVSMTRPKFEIKTKTNQETKQVLDKGSLQKIAKGSAKPGSKTGLLLGHEADKANVKARKENPAKVQARTDTQNKAEADIKAGKKLPAGALTYHFGKKHEYAGEVKNVTTKTPSFESKMGKPSFKVKEPTTKTTVSEPPKHKGLPKRKVPRREWLINREAKNFTKGERRRKKTESGHGASYKRFESEKPTYKKK